MQTAAQAEQLLYELRVHANAGDCTQAACPKALVTGVAVRAQGPSASPAPVLLLRHAARSWGPKFTGSHPKAGGVCALGPAKWHDTKPVRASMHTLCKRSVVELSLLPYRLSRWPQQPALYAPKPCPAPGLVKGLEHPAGCTHVLGGVSRLRCGKRMRMCGSAEAVQDPEQGVGQHAMQVREEMKRVRAELAKAKRKHQQEQAARKPAEKNAVAQQAHVKAAQLKLERENLILDVAPDTVRPGGRAASSAAAGAST